MLIRSLAVLVVALAQPCAATEVSGVAVHSEEGFGPFHVQRLTVTGKGSEKSLRVKWEGNAFNDSGRDWHKVTFCLKAFDAEGNALSSKDGCLLRLWMYDWKDKSPAKWKGSQKLRVGEDGKREVEVSRLHLSVDEIRTDPESVEVFTQTCDKVWPVALQAFIDKKFRPTMSGGLPRTLAEARNG